MPVIHHVLVVGTGSIGERHARCFLGTGRARVSIVEINAQLRAAICQRYDVLGFASLDEALAARPALPLDLAVVATPAHLHVDQATRLAARGLHVLVEKPLSTGIEGIDELCRVARQQSAVVGVAYVYRNFPALGALRDAIHAGRFGSPLELVVVSGQNFPTYRPAYRETYYASRQTGGGAIQDALTHLLNAGQWLLGPFDRVVADAAHCQLDGVQVEDTVHLLARHGQVLASYSLNQYQAPNETSITVVCERGTARWESHRQRWRWMTVPDEPWHDESFPPAERDQAFIAQAHQFLDTAEGKCAPLCSLEEGRHTLQVNLAALNSLDSGNWQRLPVTTQ